MLTAYDQTDTTPYFPNVLGLFGSAGITVFTCVASGFFLGCLLFLTYVIIYQVIALFAYTVRYFIRARSLDREIAAARLAAGVLALPEALPAPHPRVIWAQGAAHA